MLIDNDGQADITLVLIGHRLKFERRMYLPPTNIPDSPPPRHPAQRTPHPPSPYASHLSPPIPTPAPKVQHEVYASNNIHPLPRSLSLAPFPA